MRYMLLIYTDESQDIAPGGPEWDQLMVDYRAFGAEANRRCTFVTGDPLQSVQTATTLRMENGKRVTLDGPFAETREQLGGYYILECSKEDAIELAALVPSAKRGSIEVRPMDDHDTRVVDPPRQTRYMLMFYGVEANYPPMAPGEISAAVAPHQRFTNAAIERGEFVAGDALGSTSEAVTVRVRDGKTLVTDGPFAETKEQLGGFYILNVRDLDRMLELASNFPVNNEDGCIEIRPLQEV
jgi:hypothetical protein